ncbi:hypothetical protein [Sodalis sp.]
MMLILFSLCPRNCRLVWLTLVLV